MSENIPDWLQSCLSDDAFMPTREFIEKLEPQSRAEALLKKGVLGE